MCPAWRLSKEGQTDSQVGWQVTKSRKFHAYHWLMRSYNNRLLVINLCRLALGGQTVKNLRLLASKFELDQTQRKSTQVCHKSMQVDASGWPNEMQVEPKSKTCIALWVDLFGQGFKFEMGLGISGHTCTLLPIQKALCCYLSAVGASMPLHAAAVNGNKAVLRRLLQKGEWGE